MKFVDENHNVIGTAKVGSVKTEDGSTVELNIDPASPNHTMHEIDVPDDLLKHNANHIHETVRIMIPRN
jgi:hypothetical protein